MNRLVWPSRLMVFVAVLLAAALLPAHAAPPVLLRVYFSPGSAQLDEAAVARLDEAIPILNAEYRWQRIEIGGHTDSTADEGINIGLSQRRAQAVFDHLSAQGMEVDRFVLRAFGEARLRGPEYDAAGRAKNRRVELRLLDNPQPGILSFPSE